MPRVSDAHKERRRQAILAAAMEVFIGKGYQSSTINDIATRAEISVGAIYRYFPTKGDLILALVEQKLGRVPELFARLTEGEGDPWKRLERAVDLFTSALRFKHPATGRLLLVTLAEAVQDGEVRRGLQARFAGLVEYLEAIVKDGVEQGLFRTDVDPLALVTLLLCMGDGVAVYWVIDTPQMDLRAMRQSILAMLRAYLVKNEE